MDGGRVIQKRDRLQVVVIIVLMLVVLTLLFSGMVYKSGDLVRSEHYTISLLRFCLLNETTASMLCLSLNELEVFNGSIEAMVWARLFIYSSFVTSLFTLFSFSIDACLCEVHVWDFGIFLAMLSYLLIVSGVVLFILANWNYAAVLNLTASFSFCMIAGALLSLVVYTAWHFRPYRRPLPKSDSEVSQSFSNSRSPEQGLLGPIPVTLEHEAGTKPGHEASPS